MAYSIAVRIGRLERRLDHEVQKLLYPEAHSLALRQQRARVDQMIGTISRLRDLEKVRLAIRAPAGQTLRPRTAAPAAPSVVVVASRPTSTPRLAPVSSPPIGVFTLSAPAPQRPLRDDELEFVVAWTPHRDAKSLIGNYGRKAAR